MIFSVLSTSVSLFMLAIQCQFAKVCMMRLNFQNLNFKIYAMKFCNTCFFLITNGYLLKRAYIMFTMVNITRKNYKRVMHQYKREGIKSKIEVLCVKPHTLDQSKSVWKKNSFQLSQRLFLVFERVTIMVPPRSPHKTQRNNIPDVGRTLLLPKISICWPYHVSLQKFA